jgi:hypothetical protein
VPLLMELCDPHEHPDVVHAALSALGHLDDPRALVAFIGCKDHSDPEVRLAVGANRPARAPRHRLGQRRPEVVVAGAGDQALRPGQA